MRRAAGCCCVVGLVAATTVVRAALLQLIIGLRSLPCSGEIMPQWNFVRRTFLRGTQQQDTNMSDTLWNNTISAQTSMISLPLSDCENRAPEVLPWSKFLIRRTARRQFVHKCCRILCVLQHLFMREVTTVCTNCTSVSNCNLGCAH